MKTFKIFNNIIRIDYQFYKFNIIPWCHRHKEFIDDDYSNALYIYR